ncbi:hypothetical protein GCM10010289_28090 [Streptomyces violascens]|uniref:Uncharacterized protein n=1 Tax=Streptomyces violascens TaxID=67381 RepID=A0ABQ3QUN3_9ACTN|nr:hypothetical protein GCM10010289_28090 [Streptomyces violascens]GHI40989.1 hypothetical protein Sviol_53970 [Streptomyces violascens]
MDNGLGPVADAGIRVDALPTAGERLAGVGSGSGGRRRHRAEEGDGERDGDQRHAEAVAAHAAVRSGGRLCC